jgi:hypothetical protein
MRAIAALLVFVGSVCALAQNPAPSKSPVWPGIQIVPWSFRFSPPPKPVQPLPGQQYEAFEAALPSSVCSVKLAEMPIPKDVHFTMGVVQLPSLDRGIAGRVPAPPCP